MAKEWKEKRGRKKRGEQEPEPEPESESDSEPEPEPVVTPKRTSRRKPAVKTPAPKTPTPKKSTRRTTSTKKEPVADTTPTLTRVTDSKTGKSDWIEVSSNVGTSSSSPLDLKYLLYLLLPILLCLYLSSGSDSVSFTSIPSSNACYATKYNQKDLEGLKEKYGNLTNPCLHKGEISEFS